MKRRGAQVHGSRDELREDLLEGAEGWNHTFGRPDLAQQCEDAASQLDAGAEVVMVGHTKWVVSE